MPAPLAETLRFQLAHASGTAQQVGARFKCCYSSVLRARATYGTLRKPGRYVAPEIKALVVSMRKDGATLDAISKKTGFCVSVISKWCARENVKKAMAPDHEAKKQQVIALRREGKKLREIRSIVGFSLQTIWEWCEDARANPPAKMARNMISNTGVKLA